MIAKDLISLLIPPLKTSDDGHKALMWMNDFHIRHLPIVNNQQLLGVIAEDDILNFDNPDEPLGAHSLSLKRPYVDNDTHIYEVLKTMTHEQLSIIPVVDEDDVYLGVITQEGLLQYLAETAAFTETGSILVLEMPRHDYSMGEIARLVESERATVLSSYVTSLPNSARVEVTLKLNIQDLKHIIATFERFDYIVKASFQEDDYSEVLRERYNALVNYLNV